MLVRGGHPLLVAEHGDVAGREVIGWSHASSYRARPCYAGVAEFSVYVSKSLRGQRVGDALMAAFLPACAEAGCWKSRALCDRHGFREVGVYQKHARLDGVWRDVVIVERPLPDNLEGPPSAASEAGGS